MQEKKIEITINGVELTEWLKANKEERAIIFAIVSEGNNKRNHHVCVGTCGTDETLLTAASDLMENKHAGKWIAAACAKAVTDDLIKAITADDDEDEDDTETPAEDTEENDQQ